MIVISGTTFRVVKNMSQSIIASASQSESTNTCLRVYYYPIWSHCHLLGSITKCFASDIKQMKEEKDKDQMKEEDVSWSKSVLIGLVFHQRNDCRIISNHLVRLNIWLPDN